MPATRRVSHPDRSRAELVADRTSRSGTELILKLEEYLPRRLLKNSRLVRCRSRERYDIVRRADEEGRKGIDAIRDERVDFEAIDRFLGGSITLDCADSRTLRRLERRLERNILKAMGVSGANAATLGEDDD